MKLIVAHASPDWDAITSVWLIKRFLPGWENASVNFVPAGQRYRGIQFENKDKSDPIEIIEDEKIIHVDTGLGPLDHHQTSDKNVCAASLTWDYVRGENSEFIDPSDKIKDRIEALNRLVSIIVDIDHFGEVFWANPDSDYHEFSLLGLLEGIKMARPNQDQFYVDFGMECLDAELHNFENRIWAEREIKSGLEFETSYGKGIAFETLNDTVMKLSQKMGYIIAIRKDPRKGYVRIKTRPESNSHKGTSFEEASESGKKGIDLTPVYEKLKEMDPKATWFLHVSRKMLLNGTPKNPKMIPSVLSLQQIVDVVKSL